jgi:hypothetical protein
MNDPHVVALIYKIQTRRSIDYDKAPPLGIRREDLDISVSDGEVRISFTDAHHSTADEARQAVDGFIEAWEIVTGLTRGPGEFGLKFHDAEIIDRAPSPGQIRRTGGAKLSFGGPSQFHFSVDAYPPPPPDFKVSDGLALMYRQYERYRLGRATLASVAYFCFTCIRCLGKESGGPTKHFQISQNVLDAVRILSSRKGGGEGRKADAARIDWTQEERHWLEEAVHALVLRVAERDMNPNAALPQITRSNLRPSAGNPMPNVGVKPVTYTAS